MKARKSEGEIIRDNMPILVVIFIAVSICVLICILNTVCGCTKKDAHMGFREMALRNKYKAMAKVKEINDQQSGLDSILEETDDERKKNITI